MIEVEGPLPAVRENAEEIAQKVLQTDMTNIVMSQWQAELHHEQGQDPCFIAYCAINRRLDPLEKPLMLHMVARDGDHLRMMFRHVSIILT